MQVLAEPIDRLGVRYFAGRGPLLQRRGQADRYLVDTAQLSDALLDRRARMLSAARPIARARDAADRPTIK